MAESKIWHMLNTMNTLRARYARKAFEWGDPTEIISSRMDDMENVIKTLEWLQTHEEIIRDAIASAKALDAVAER